MNIFFGVFLLSVLFVFSDGGESICTEKELSETYLDAAMDLLKKAKNAYPSEALTKDMKYADCDDWLKSGFNRSGIYVIYPRNRVMQERHVDVYCDMDTDGGGWTVIQRRGNFLRAQDYFFKDWESYKNGFGDIEKDFWLGNDNIFAISNQKEYSARFDLKSVEGDTRYALYDSFWIDDEYHKYMLHISGYSGNAGDSMIPRHDQQMFSTKDQENDKHKDYNCAMRFKGAWWYEDCFDSHLNGLLSGKNKIEGSGLNWKTWKGYKESLQETEIKLRPKKSKLLHIVSTPHE